MKKLFLLQFALFALILFILPLAAFANFADDDECNDYCETACQSHMYAEECNTECQAAVCYLQGNQKSETDVNNFVSSYAGPQAGACIGEPGIGTPCGDGGTCQCYETILNEGDSCDGGTGVIRTGLCAGSNNVRCCEPLPEAETGTGTGTGTGTETGSTSRTIEVTNPLGNTEESRNPVTIIGSVIRSLLIFMGVITLVMFIYAGILMMMSGGNEEAFKKGRNIMVYTIIGLIIVLSSYSILTFIFNRLAQSTGAAIEQTAPAEETDNTY